MDATCKNCPLWTRRVPPEDQTPQTMVRGDCHHASVGEETTRVETWWCSEHPQRQRDRLAAMAMQGLLANANATGTAVDPSAFAGAAYAIADAMLAARDPNGRDR